MSDKTSLILELIDDTQRSLNRLRALVAVDSDCLPVFPNGSSPSATFDGEGDFDEANLITTGEAAQIAQLPKGTLQRWCRDYGIGRRKGDRWQVSLPRLRRRLGQG